MLTVLAAVTLALGFLSFLLFLVLAWSARKTQPGVGGQLEAGLDDTVKLVNALEKLAATLSKAGPWLASLIAAIFFVSIAFAAATADRLSDKVPTPTTTVPRR